MDTSKVKTYLLQLQELIVSRMEALDGKPFRRDAWERPEGGGGISRLVEEGNILERAGVNFARHGRASAAFGHRAPPGTGRPPLGGDGGVAGVPSAQSLHSHRAHERALLRGRKDGEAPVWWFGGGMDLTPYYGFEEDAVHFHATCRKALEPFGPDWHPRFKKWCDEYFFLKHRNEPRGWAGFSSTI